MNRSGTGRRLWLRLSDDASAAQRFGQTGENIPALLEELRRYLGPEKPGQAVKAIPGQGSNLPITLLGSSGFSA